MTYSTQEVSTKLGEILEKVQGPQVSAKCSGSSHRPNGPGDLSPGLRPKADALGQQEPPPCGLKGRESPA